MIKEIEKGIKQFSNNEKMIEFATCLSENLTANYKKRGYLTTYEMGILDKALKEGIYKLSFLLLSDLKGKTDKKLMIKALKLADFKLIKKVGYINAERIVPYIEF